MNRRRPQQYNAAELVGEFWKLQNDPRSSQENHFAQEPLSDSAQIDLAAIAEALSPDRQKFGSAKCGRFPAVHHALMQNSRMTFLESVRSRFVPQHVIAKSGAGQKHYHAILKHILSTTVL